MQLHENLWLLENLCAWRLKIYKENRKNGKCCFYNVRLFLGLFSLHFREPAPLYFESLNMLSIFKIVIKVNVLKSNGF